MARDPATLLIERETYISVKINVRRTAEERVALVGRRAAAEIHLSTHVSLTMEYHYHQGYSSLIYRMVQPRLYNCV